MRDNKYLEFLLYDIWENHFCDVPRLNIVDIRFGKYSKRQLGCIRMIKDREMFEKYVKKMDVDIKMIENPSISRITLTKYFTKEYIPEYVIRSTIVHELCHYTHGFNSPLNQIYSHPHRGNIIKKEFQERDLDEIYTLSRSWLKENWVKIVS